VKAAGNPELTTQAWCKLTECLWRYSLLEGFSHGEGLVTVHLCEAPGAFVSALNHYQASLATRYPSWEWRATSLNPFHEGNKADRMINDDRLILRTLSHWTFGEDATGDLLVQPDPGWLAGNLTSAGLAHLVTADGSVDCHLSPSRQEEDVARLLRAETSVALSVLRPGGNFVLKVFTLFQDDTVSLLLLLKFAFAKVDLFKPASSKEGNSEVYAICRFYRDNLSPALLAKLGSDPQEAAPLFGRGDIPEDFLSEVQRAAGFFQAIQRFVILRNLETFDLRPKPRRRPKTYPPSHQEALQDRVAEEFLRRYPVAPLSAEDKLLPADCELPLPPNFFSARQDCAGETPAAMLVADDVERELVRTTNPTRYKLNNHRTLQWLTLPGNLPLTLEAQYGTEVEVIRTSKFCPPSALGALESAYRLCRQGSSGRQAAPGRFWQSLGWAKMSDPALRHCPLVKKVAQLLPTAREKTLVVAAPKECDNYLRRAAGAGAFVGLLERLAESVVQLEFGKNLMVTCMPLLHRRNVSLLHVVARHFDRVACVEPEDGRDALLFERLLSPPELLASRIASLGSLMKCPEAGPRTVAVSFFPIAELASSPGYPDLCVHNMRVVRSLGLKLLGSQQSADNHPSRLREEDKSGSDRDAECSCSERAESLSAAI
jgi:23S rRNA U2552 (ribose-2'-O)-methylase RlmE/FtsJ